MRSRAQEHLGLGRGDLCGRHGQRGRGRAHRLQGGWQPARAAGRGQGAISSNSVDMYIYIHYILLLYYYYIYSFIYIVYVDINDIKGYNKMI